MRILSVRHIDGPNIYIYKPVMVARVDLEEFTERESYEFTGFADRLLTTFPGLREHHCAKGAPGGFVERLYSGTYFGHIVEHLTIELSCCVGLDVHFGKTLYAGNTGEYDMIMECKSYECQRFLLNHAVEMIQAFVRGARYDVQSVLREAAEILQRTELGPSTKAILDAAVERNIPVRRLAESGSLIQLGYGRERKLVQATMTENTSAVSVDIACDKELTKRVLEDAGIRVPEGGAAYTLDEALELFRRFGPPVVIKPYDGNQGRGVSLNIQTEQEVAISFDIAKRNSSKVIVERHVKGKNVRLLVVGTECVAASVRIPAHVVGDGQHTVHDLIEELNQNPLRGEDHEKPLTKVMVDQIVEQTLERQGFTLTDVPFAGVTVYLRDSANLSTGGEAIDVTGEIHSSLLKLAERVARIIGLDICGIDMVIPDITEPYDPAVCAVIEVNAAPGIRMHQHPSYGERREVARAIVDSLFPGSTTGRIPIVAITGTNGKTTTSRLIAHGFQLQGKTVGLTSTGGVYINAEKILDGDTTGPKSAHMILSDPSVEVAVLETARGGIVRGGLAYDKANVAVLTNITLDHVGQDGAETVEDLLHVKSLVAECVHEDGVVVLNADDEHLVELSKRLKSRVVFFSTRDDNKVLKRHLALGGVGYYISRGWIMEGRGNLSWDIALARDIPLTLGGKAPFQLENCLAAVSALRASGLTRQQVAVTLRNFDPTLNNPGRLSIYRMPNGGHVVLDYGHNPDGFDKVGAWLASTQHRQRIGIVGVPGDRADMVVRQSAKRLAEIFDVLIVKEDADKRGRTKLEIANMMADEIRLVRPEKPCIVIESELDALLYGLRYLGPRDIAVVFYEKMTSLKSVLEDNGGVQVSKIVEPSPQSVAAML